MNAIQIAVRTAVTTIDVLLLIAMFKANNEKDFVKKAVLVFVLVNVMGVWI